MNPGAIGSPAKKADGAAVPSAVIASTFFTGTTGREWRAWGRECQVLALYLIVAPAASPYGLYRLPIVTIMEDTGLANRPLLQRMLARFSGQRYALYDPDSAWVWVREMARWQIAPHGPLSRRDHRARGAQRWYARCPSNPFLGAYWDHYHRRLHLPTRREGERPWAAPSPADAADLTAPDVMTHLAVIEEFEVVPSTSEVASRLLCDRWLARYPPHARGAWRQVERDRAYEAWRRIRPPANEQFLSYVMAAVERQIRGNGPCTRMTPARWLDERRWFL